LSAKRKRTRIFDLRGARTRTTQSPRKISPAQKKGGSPLNEKGVSNALLEKKKMAQQAPGKDEGERPVK